MNNLDDYLILNGDDFNYRLSHDCELNLYYTNCLMIFFVMICILEDNRRQLFLNRNV